MPCAPPASVPSRRSTPSRCRSSTTVYTPTADEIAGAQRIIELAEQADGGVFVDDDGRMIDEAVLRSARRVLGTT